jgi:lysophospholipase L1-like esterase
MIFENMDRIVFTGDSVTDAGCAKPVGEGLFDSLGHGYVREVENLLVACYPELNLRITNTGVSGNTSRALLNRFDDAVIKLNPEWVSICIGINDVWRQFDCPAMPDSWVLPDEYEKNVEKMILSVKDKVKDFKKPRTMMLAIGGAALGLLAGAFLLRPKAKPVEEAQV